MDEFIEAAKVVVNGKPFHQISEANDILIQVSN